MGSVILWRAPDWRPAGTVLPGETDVTRIVLDRRSGAHALVLGRVKDASDRSQNCSAVLWDVAAKTYQVIPTEFAGKDVFDDDAALSPDGKLVAFRKDSVGRPCAVGRRRAQMAMAGYDPAGRDVWLCRQHKSDFSQLQ